MQAGDEISEGDLSDRVPTSGAGRTHSPRAGERGRACESTVRVARTAGTGAARTPPEQVSVVSLRANCAGRNRAVSRLSPLHL